MTTINRVVYPDMQPMNPIQSMYPAHRQPILHPSLQGMVNNGPMENQMAVENYHQPYRLPIHTLKKKTVSEDNLSSFTVEDGVVKAVVDGDGVKELSFNDLLTVLLWKDEFPKTFEAYSQLVKTAESFKLFNMCIDILVEDNIIRTIIVDDKPLLPLEIIDPSEAKNYHHHHIMNQIKVLRTAKFDFKVDGDGVIQYTFNDIIRPLNTDLVFQLLSFGSLSVINKLISFANEHMPADAITYFVNFKGAIYEVYDNNELALPVQLIGTILFNPTI